jgi:peptidoglycan hydrolase-like protein with peptidoglycan-binding domain
VGYESRPLSSGGTASGGGGIRLPEGISLQASQGAGFVVPAKYAPALIVTRPLAQGSRSEEVRALQEVLARDKSIYPEGIVSGYFGPLTTRAIQVFQRRHGIISFGDSESTGYGVLGPRTLAKLNEIYGTARESGGGGGAAGGLIKKSEPPIFAEAPRQGIVSPVDSPARRALVEAIRAELAVIAEKARKLIEQAAALFGSPR